MYTQTITVKIDKPTHNQLINLAENMNVAKSQLVRQAINRLVKESAPRVGQSLINMARKAKKHQYQAPQDIIENLNKYLYDKA